MKKLFRLVSVIISSLALLVVLSACGSKACQHKTWLRGLSKAIQLLGVSKLTQSYLG